MIQIPSTKTRIKIILLVILFITGVILGTSFSQNTITNLRKNIQSERIRYESIKGQLTACQEVIAIDRKVINHASAIIGIAKDSVNYMIALDSESLHNATTEIGMHNDEISLLTNQVVSFSETCYKEKN